ncbi:MAG: DUF2207 domain-containing protein, partial [Actinomycetes bacterium]
MSVKGSLKRTFGWSNRFTRILVLILMVVVTMLGVFWPLVDSSTGTKSTYDPVSVIEYTSEISVAADGNMTATETLLAKFPSDRHGIYRFFDTTDPSNPNIRRVPQITSITRDGTADPVEISWQSNNRIMVAKIGNPDVSVTPGAHTYVIAYTVPGVISPVSAGANKAFSFTAGENSSTPGESAFFWNVVAQGWQLDMDKVTVHVTLPSPSQQVQCDAGGSATLGPRKCTIAGAGTNSITFTTPWLPANTGVVVRATMAPPPPTNQPGLITTPWPVSWLPVLGQSGPLAVLVLLLTLLAFVAGLLWVLRSREHAPGFPVMYSPPPGLGPAQTVFMTAEDTGKYALNATLFQMAATDLVTLQHQSKDSWIITSAASADQWEAADPASRAVGDVLRLTGGGSRSFAADRGVHAGRKLQEAKGKIGPAVRKWAADTGNVLPVGSERWAKRVWFAAVVLAALWFLSPIIHSFGPTMYGLPFAAFAIGGFGLMHPGVGTRRTEAGRELWSKCGGFARLLSTDSSQDRFDFSANSEQFLSFIPYAVAFGVADKWAAKYRMYTSTEPPTPDWYPYGVGLATWYSGSGGFADFDSTISSSIGSYEASLSSSSDSGG